MFLRDAARLADCRKRANLCPLGSGAVAGATLTLNRQAMAAELGFDGPAANSIDATSDRDFAIEFVDALSLLALHLSRWAEEMILFSTPAYGFVELPEPYSTGSSAMPQKKKSRLAGAGARQSGARHGMRHHAANFVEGPAARLQQRPAGNAGAFVQRLRHGHRHVAARDRIYEHRRIQRSQDESGRKFGIYERVGRGRLPRRRGVPSRLAHEAVGRAVQLAVDYGCELQKLPLADLQAIHPSFDAAFRSCLGLTEVLALHDVPAAPRHVTSSARCRMLGSGLTCCARQSRLRYASHFTQAAARNYDDQDRFQLASEYGIYTAVSCAGNLWSSRIAPDHNRSPASRSCCSLLAICKIVVTAHRSRGLGRAV